MLIVTPVTVTESMIVSANVAEDDAPAYSADATYGVGDLCVYAHAVYKSAAASNIGNTPATSTTVWVRVSATNRHKCLDTSNTSQTISAGPISYRIKPGRVITSVALLNVSGASARIRVVDPVTGTVVDKTSSLTGVQVSSGWFNFFYQRRRAVRQVLEFDIPSYYDAEVLIDIIPSFDGAMLGVLFLGYADRWGLGVQYGARVGITDYSKTEADEYGDVRLMQLGYAKRASFDLIVKNEEIDALQEALADLRATPVLIVASRHYACTVIYGWIGEFDILISYNTFSECSIDFKGLT